MAEIVAVDEESAKKIFLARKQKSNAHQTSADKEKLHNCKQRISELDTLMQSVYEDKVKGEISAVMCSKLLDKYEKEQHELSDEVLKIESRLVQLKQDESDVDKFIERIRKYTNVEVLTREMCLELIEYITIDEFHKGKKDRNIHIYYKFIDKGYTDKTN